MDRKSRKRMLICDNEADHSFSLEGELRNREDELVIVTKSNGLLESAKSLHPVAVLVNPDLNGFNEDELVNT